MPRPRAYEKKGISTFFAKHPKGLEEKGTYPLFLTAARRVGRKGDAGSVRCAGRLDQWVAKRRRCAALYGRLLFDGRVKLPVEAAYGRSAYHRFVVQIAPGRRDAVHEALLDRGIETRSGCAAALQLDSAYRHPGHTPGDFPVTESLAENALCLPMFELMTQDEVTHVAAVLRNLL